MSTIFTLALSGARATVAVGIEIPHGPGGGDPDGAKRGETYNSE